MSDFYPDGYVPLQQAVYIAAKFWFPEKVASHETAVADNPTLRVLSHSYPQLPEDFRQAFEETAGPTVRRLRNFLHQSELIAYYFTGDGCHSLPHKFWATTQANGVIESGTYWPAGRPMQWYDRPPNYPIFVKQSELDALLVKEVAENRRLPLARKTELAAAYRRPEIAALPTRNDQREAIKKLAPFKSYRITDHLFREAEKASGKREPGVKGRQDD